MQRLGLLNMIIGFFTLLLAACAGAFISFDMTQAYLRDPSLLHEWQMTLLKSAHGHSNLFGMLHVLLGLTLPYSPLPVKFKALQTLGLFLGVVAMGPLMFIRASYGPTDSFEGVGLLIGAGLSAALLTVGSHASALLYKFMKRQA